MTLILQSDALSMPDHDLSLETFAHFYIQNNHTPATGSDFQQYPIMIKSARIAITNETSMVPLANDLY